MRIASYNLFEGARDTFPELTQFIRRQQIDILCVQEANGWNEGHPTRLAQLAAATGLDSYVYGNSNTRFKLATLSREPIQNSQVYTEGFWHCAIRTTLLLNGTSLDVWNVHLNPRAESDRLEEAKLMASMIDLKRPTIIMGDYNSLNRTDLYPPGLIHELADQGIRKFGTDTLVFDVTDYFLREGFVDVARTLNSQESTVPTPANTDANHATQLRLDYMYATPSAMDYIGSFTTVKNSLTNRISDHYPNVATLRQK